MKREYTQAAWQAFQEQETLTETQIEQFKWYYAELVAWNNEVNLTRITDEQDVIFYHFQDSLSVAHAVSFESVTTISDIGSGAGFPSIPLKIKYPHLQVVIIEVSGKRISFLQHVIDTLGLTNVTLCQQDWRTFLRHQKHTIDYFFARASLTIPELLRMFKPTSAYKNAHLVYWAADQWHPVDDEVPFMQKEYYYRVGDKKRRLIFFGLAEMLS